MNLDDTTPTENTDAPSRTQKPFSFVTVIFFILIIAIAGLSFVAWQKLHEENKQLKQQTARLLDNLGHTDLHIDTLKKAVKDKLFTQEQTLHQLQASLTKLRAGRTGQSEDWLVDESRHLIRLANYTLQVQKNIPLAIKLLTIANDSLQPLENPNILPLKQSISDDLATLKNARYPNEETLYLQLSTLDKLIGTLPFPQLEKSAPKATKAEDSGWHSALKANLEKLRGLVVIRRYTQNAPTALSDKQLNALYHNLHLHLATAQYALMQKNQVIYQQSLTQIHTWVETYFDKKNKTTTQALLLTKQLAKISIDPTIPMIHLPTMPQNVQTPPPPEKQTNTLPAATKPEQEAIQL